MAHNDSELLLVEQHVACTRRLKQLLPTLITPPPAAAATRGGFLSPCSTVLCIQELHERMNKLGLEDLHHQPCRADVGVGLYSIAFKLNRSGNVGLGGQDAWRIALMLPQHVWALHVHSARDAGPLKHLAVLDVEMRADWLLRIETLLLEALGRGLWDVVRSQTVDGVLQCVSEHIDIAACADLHGMVDSKTVDAYVASSTGAVLKAAYAFLSTHIGTQKHLLLLAETWLKTLDTFDNAYYQRFAEPVHMHKLGRLHGQLETLVHAVVLLCEYVLLCQEASGMLPRAVEPGADSLP
jgi:hypothetical protein